MLIIPKFSPLIIVILSCILLVAGTYHHFTLFKNEYKQSTWQDALTLFAPGIMILVILLYIFIAITGIFEEGSIPVPTLPTMELPSAETATNPVTAALNSTISAVNSVANSAANTVASVTNSATNAAESVANSVVNSVGLGKRNNNSRNNNSGPTRSFLATV